jgi:asparagine synthase (glutamine-hydrolysing)
MVFGTPRRPPPLPPAGDPRAALEAAVRRARGPGPCFVSFSGGRDSSVVLAAAARAARRDGLEPPIPVTARFMDAPDAEESAWQERVVRHVGAPDWIRLELGDELDAIGPYAQAVLARHGVLWPFNAHFHAPMLACAAGGTLLTGIGGDELWAAVAARAPRLRRRALALAPRSLRRGLLAHRESLDLPWLSVAGRRAASRAAAADSAAVPMTLARRLRWLRGLRATAVGTASLALIAADADAAIAHPLLDAGVWAAAATSAPDPDRARRAMAGHLLPEEVIARRTKATFDAVFFRDPARAFSARWSGGGVPADLVDEGLLRDHWASARPMAQSFALLQAVWASTGERLQQPVGGLGQ